MREHFKVRVFDLRVMIIPLAAAILLPSPTAALPLLATAANFSVLGASTVTNTGPTTVNGDYGVYPGTALTGTGSVTLTGTFHAGDATAQLAQSDAANAFTNLSGLSSAGNLTGVDLGGLTLSPGVYSFATSAQLTGTLILDFATNPGGAFVFQIGSTLTTASGSSVTALNGNGLSGIYFQVGSSATLGTGTTFVGNILAAQSITLNTGSKVLCGRAIALNAAVTLDTNTISNNCSAGGNLGSGITDFGSGGFDGAGRAPGTGPVPEPGVWALMIAGFGLTGGAARRRRIA